MLRTYGAVGRSSFLLRMGSDILDDLDDLDDRWGRF